MAFCGKCGGEVAAGAGFCPKCGTAQTPEAVAKPAQSGDSGLSENVAGFLCYLFGWVTGLIFFMIDKRPFVRFHAAQSIVVFGGLHILMIVMGVFFGTGMMFHGGYGAFGFWAAISGLINLAAFVLWILLMVKAYQHEKFEVPIAANVAKGFSGS